IDDGVSVSAPFAPGPDAWTHVAGTFDGTALRLYVDGVMVGEAEAPPPYFSAIEWTIGAGIDMGVPGTHFAGAIDELRLYRGALTPEEIAALVASP
ncbi:MAG: LamG domain-containing protein, partial [Myxococcales bacterium]|nr:LamG domain-containing protein [Myxococcales bacterium]